VVRICERAMKPHTIPAGQNKNAATKATTASVFVLAGPLWAYGEYGSCGEYGGIGGAGGGAENSFLIPQERQNASLAASGAPHFGQKVDPGWSTR
jgi:hypothetical protein